QREPDESSKKTHLVGDFSSSAQFFVTFAVFVFLYCMAALVLYVGYLHLYRGAGKLPMIDFVITVVVAFLWLVSTSAWAKALTDIKLSTGPGIVSQIPFCQTSQRSCGFDGVSSMGSLNVSVVRMANTFPSAAETRGELGLLQNSGCVVGSDPMVGDLVCTRTFREVNLN
uniref:MARVEL domain-containing protein n=1 Tax=Pelusios castaneus TaxID=367368 RepID=A0A8C8RKR0_9SAUR